MIKQVKAIVLTGFGTNCETEMAHACRLGGADRVDIVHISELLYGEYSLDDYHFLNLPGGFLDGDDLGAGQAGAHRMKYAVVRDSGEKLQEQLLRFINAGKLILGVCNGFQLMVKMGLLPAFANRHDDRQVSLTYNEPFRGPLGQPRRCPGFPLCLHHRPERSLFSRASRGRQIRGQGRADPAAPQG